MNISSSSIFPIIDSASFQYITNFSLGTIVKYSLSFNINILNSSSDNSDFSILER